MTLMTIRQFASKHTAFTEGSLRHLIFYERTNGMSMCIRRVGRRVLIDEETFFLWIEQQTNRQNKK